MDTVTEQKERAENVTSVVCMVHVEIVRVYVCVYVFTGVS